MCKLVYYLNVLLYGKPESLEGETRTYYNSERDGANIEIYLRS